MSEASPVLVRDGREGRDRLEIMTALVNAPSFDLLFRSDIIGVPPNHPVYRWECLVTDCGRPRAGRGDLCGAHETMWRQRRGEQSRAGFLRSAEPVGLGEEVHERPCRICPSRPSRQLTLELCHHHQFSWYHYRDRPADFEVWLAEQQPHPGYGRCRVQVCPGLAESPLRCATGIFAAIAAKAAPERRRCRCSGAIATSGSACQSRSITSTRRRSGAGA